MIVTFKALRTGTPGYLSDLLVKPAITRSTRSRSTDAPDRLVVSLYNGERSASTSYSVAAPKLWNSLPANIRSSKSLDTFKKHLKTHYLKKTPNCTIFKNFLGGACPEPPPPPANA